MTVDPTLSSATRLTYGITPPKTSTNEERRRAIAVRQTGRISELPVDAVVIYDLQDESSRTEAKRPFPFMRAIDPLEYAYDYLAEVPQKKIVYRSVADIDRPELVKWMQRLRDEGGNAVLVGAPSRHQATRLGLREAYGARKSEVPDLPLGGVMIAERHEARGGEDGRVLRKVEHGCSFFISQAVYSVSASKNLLSDLYYRCEAQAQSVPPILVTLSPCGSLKTLEFMAWLGVSVPSWLSNELEHARDILERSVDLSVAAFEEIYDFAREKEMPLGCNIESVSLSKAEIDASVEMVHRVARVLGRSE
jgi:hypothetical protein